MTLLADYQARYSTQIRTNLSNPQSSGATTPNTTQETYAAADAQADFEAICGVTYSSSVTTHVAAAVPLVVAKLMVYTAQADETYYDAALNRCKDIYRLVLGRNRITPQSDSALTPTTDRAGDKPAMDRSQFKRFIGNAPGRNANIDSGVNQTTTD